MSSPYFANTFDDEYATCWERTTGNRHVWFNSKTKKYTFEDETNNFNGEFDTYLEASKALLHHISFYL